MAKIGVFFGTNSGTTRLIAKKLAAKLGDVADKPVNVNRVTLDEFLSYRALILGTPSYADGQMPSLAQGIKDGSWQEFLPKLKDQDLSGKTVAFYGLGDQVKYSAHFVSALGKLCTFFKARGANVVGAWSIDGYTFDGSDAVVDGKFCGLVIDADNQPLLTETRLTEWVALVKDPLLLA